MAGQAPPDDRRDEKELKGLFLLHLASNNVWSHRPPGLACVAPEELDRPSRCGVPDPPSPSTTGTGRNAGLPNPSSLPAIIS